MSQNPFGAPSGPAPDAPTVPSAEEAADSKRTKLLVLGGAGLAGIVLAGAAALMLSGGDDLVAPAPVAAPNAPAPTSTSSTTTAAPLPTNVEFAGRNPFEATIVESGGGGGEGGAAAEGGQTGGESGGQPAPTTAPEPPAPVAPDLPTTVFVPGPTVTRTVPGPVVTETVPGPATEVPVPGPTETVFVTPGDIELAFFGTDLAPVTPEEREQGIEDDDETLADFGVNGFLVQDVNPDERFAFFFKLLEVEEGDPEAQTPDRAHVMFGDTSFWIEAGTKIDF